MSGEVPGDGTIDRVRTMMPALLRYFLRRVDDREDAADLLSETLLVVWRRIEDVPASDDEMRMWLYGVAGGVLRNARRTLRRRSALAERLRLELHTESAPEAASSDIRIDVQRAIATLARRDRELVRLIHWDGLTVAEAAAALGINASTARTRYARARARLATALGASEASEGESHSAPRLHATAEAVPRR